MTILFIEEDKIVRDILSRILKKRNYQVISAENGREAFNIVCQFNIDLVLFDFDFEIPSGIQVFRNIRKIEPDIKMVVISSYLKDEEITCLSEDTILLNKPSSIKEIVEAIEILK